MLVTRVEADIARSVCANVPYSRYDVLGRTLRLRKNDAGFTVARFSKPSERSAGAGVATMAKVAQLRKHQPGKVRFGPSAWKAEQLLLGSPNE